MLLLLDASGQTAVYLPLANVRALAVRMSDDVLTSLSGGLLVKPDGPAPTRLQLKRQSRDLADQLNVPLEVLFEAVPDNDEASLALKRGLELLAGVLSEVRSDDEGRQSFQQSVKSIQLGPRSGASTVELQDGRLAVWYELEAGTLRLPESTVLKWAIERLL